MAPPTISGYTIEKLLGRGGFASVYLAIRNETGESVALKVLYEHSTEDADIKRFERERMSLAALTGHPHIVDIVDFGETADGHHYIALEYVEGGSIADRLRTAGAMHWADAARVGVHICSALGVAHRAGVLHRDIKPANILYGPDGAKLGDFGIARLVGQSQLTAAQSIIGTLAYTPPEVLHNSAFDGRGDIYQLGITLYEMLLGRAPFKSGSSDNKAIVIRRILDNPAPPLAQFDIPQPISDLLDQVLAKDPADRPQTADEFASELNEAELALGQTPTIAGADTQTLAMPSSGGGSSDPASPAGVSARSRTPTPPDISEPISDRTIAETRPVGSTAIFADSNVGTESRRVDVAPPSRSPEPPGATRLPGAAQPAPPGARDGGSASTPSTRRPVPTQRAPSAVKRRTGLIIGTLAVLTVAIVGGIAALQLLGGEEDGASDPGPDAVTTTTEPELEVKPTIERMDQPAFTDPGAPQGAIVSAVANSAGVTAVGGVGQGDSAGDQSSAIWTMSPDEVWDFRRNFPLGGQAIDDQKMLGIGVLDGDQFLAVGESGDGDGVAWLARRVDELAPLSDPSFEGPGVQRLFAAAGDPIRTQFLVAGAHTSGGPATPGLWIVAPDGVQENGDPDWTEPIWTLIPIRGERQGELTDVAVAGDNAVSVGWETSTAGRVQGLVMIRRNDIEQSDTWVNLLAPIPDTRLNSVDFFGDRIVAVGTREVNNVSRPVAIVADTSGIGLIHELPMADDRSGIANDVVETAAGVFAVGVTGESPGDGALANKRTDGALWQFVPGEAPEDDRWRTRDTDALADQPGYQEFQSVVEYKGRVFALGRTDGENDGETVPAVWTVSVGGEEGADTEPDDEVVQAQIDAAPAQFPESIEVGDAERGLSTGGCAAVAEVDAGAALAAVLQAATEDFALWICSDAEGRLWYHGAERDGPSSITLSAEQAPDGEGYVATNGTGTDITEYRIADGRLTVTLPDGSDQVDQPLL